MPGRGEAGEEASVAPEGGPAPAAAGGSRGAIGGGSADGGGSLGSGTWRRRGQPHLEAGIGGVVPFRWFRCGFFGRRGKCLGSHFSADGLIEPGRRALLGRPHPGSGCGGWYDLAPLPLGEGELLVEVADVGIGREVSHDVDAANGGVLVEAGLGLDGFLLVVVVDEGALQGRVGQAGLE